MTSTNSVIGWFGLAACALGGFTAGCTPSDHGPVSAIAGGPLGSVGAWATPAQRETFERGRLLANQRFDLEDGLGPAFNVTFCAACHERPTTGGSAGLYRNFFLSGLRTPEGAFFPGQSAGSMGGVIQHYAYGADLPARPAVPAETQIFAQRNAIPFFGIGLLAELPEQAILRHADPDDDDGDGISGRPNYDRGYVGRFGRKAQTVSIEAFIRGPLFNHAGITSDPLSDEQRRQLPVNSSSTAPLDAWLLSPQALLAHAQAAAPDGPLVDDDGVPDPELSPDALFDLVSFAMLLAAPAPEPLNDVTRAGLRTFDAIGCNKCHVPRLEGPKGPLPVYSDLLLHDMGPDLADGIEQGEAEGFEFRTQPLWGIVATGPYLHDGRAFTIDEAILWHGGEGQRARDAYAALTDDEKSSVIEFLKSLGGRDQFTPGLIPPNTPIAEVSTYGGPRRTLSPSEREMFLLGRDVFDRDHGYTDGVGGPRLNGDSCRACHFDPVVGGAGPRDVNVIRQGIYTPSSGFVAPAEGAVLHKTTALLQQGIRAGAQCNVFEHRQTLPLFGLGLIEDIPETEIESRADPDDADGDGISGRVPRIEDGRLARFGWKGSVPSLAEFVRDAMGVELGMTLLPEPGLSFGITSDDDGIPDPELSPDDAAALLFWLRELAPPPRQPSEAPEVVEQGEAVFTELRCNACHVPALPAPQGPVTLYSDLLLHEVLPADVVGTEEASANMREFRTAPLWGVSQTAPYWHSGEADTLDEAIRLHDGEARVSRDAYAALPGPARDALIRFLESL